MMRLERCRVPAWSADGAVWRGLAARAYLLEAPSTRGDGATARGRRPTSTCRPAPRGHDSVVTSWSRARALPAAVME